MNAAIHSGLVLSPVLPVWLLVALGALAVAAVAVAFAAGSRGRWWRVAAALIFVYALLEPHVAREQIAAMRDTAVLVVDRSPSQGLAGREDTTDRAAESLRAKLDAVPGLDVRVVTSGGEDTDGTRLFAALDEAVLDLPADRIAGAILVTDGRIHDARPGAWPYPVHGLLTGSRDDGDRTLRIENAPRYGIVGRDIALTLRIDDPASVSARDVALRIKLDGGSEQRRTVRTKQSVTLRLPLERTGESLIEIAVDDGPRELTLRNNRVAVVINGVRDRLRVLLVSGEPHPGERVWRNMLKSDPSVDLIHFTILRPPEKQDATPIDELALIPFPIRELFQDRLGEFDLVIFDRYRERGLLPLVYMQNIVDYVEAGGALLVAAGPSFAGPWSLFQTPIGAILPAAPSGRILDQAFRPALTETGRRHPVTASLARRAGERNWGRWFRQIEAGPAGTRLQGQTLMTGGSDDPLVVLARTGQGRVAQILSDHVWLWARGYDGGGPHDELLRRISHWLMKEPELEENALHARATDRGLAIERRSLEPGGDPVTVTAPSGKTTVVRLAPSPADGTADAGGDRATIRVSEAGLYRITDGIRETTAAVGTLNPLEFADVTATDAVLAPVAGASGGGVLWLEDGVPDIRRTAAKKRFGDGWIGLSEKSGQTVVGIERTPLLPPFVVIALLLGALGIAWWRESR